MRCPLDIQVEMRSRQLEMGVRLRGAVQAMDINVRDIRAKLVFKAMRLNRGQEK